jgi:hypothetical protein
MKQLIMLSVLFCSVSLVKAQLKSVSASAFQNDMRKVVKDYFNNFKNLINEELVQNPQSTDYSSSLTPAGAESCVITKYTSLKRSMYSFESVLMTTDDFETAQKQFKSYYSQLNNLTVKLSTVRTLSLKGNYESPEEEKKFTSVLFDNDANDEASKRMKVELLMEYGMLEWKIKVLIYERERNDSDPPLVEGERSLL